MIQKNRATLFEVAPFFGMSSAYIVLNTKLSQKS